MERIGFDVPSTQMHLDTSHVLLGLNCQVAFRVWNGQQAATLTRRQVFELRG